MLKDDFDKSYELLCDKIYKCDGYSYDENVQGSKKNPELIRHDLLELKVKIDGHFKFYIRQIYRHLDIREYE